MPFDIFEGKEVRFSGGGKKYVPDPGKYEVEICDTIDTVFNEKSGITSLIMDFKVVKSLSGNDDTNIGCTVRTWFPDGIKFAQKKLKATISATGMARKFDELYDDVPTMDMENWKPFLKDIKDKLTFKHLGIEIDHKAGTKGPMANISSMFPVNGQKKTNIAPPVDGDFAWPKSE
jgi:hypothetical protein